MTALPFALPSALPQRPGAAPSARPPAASAADARLRATATDFESVFLETVFDRMLSDLGEDGPLGSNGSGGDVWRTQLAGQYAKATARAGGLGIADSIHRELVRLQAAGGPERFGGGPDNRAAGGPGTPANANAMGALHASR